MVATVKLFDPFLFMTRYGPSRRGTNFYDNPLFLLLRIWVETRTRSPIFIFGWGFLFKSAYILFRSWIFSWFSLANLNISASLNKCGVICGIKFSAWTIARRSFCTSIGVLSSLPKVKYRIGLLVSFYPRKYELDQHISTVALLGLYSSFLRG